MNLLSKEQVKQLIEEKITKQKIDLRKYKIFKIFGQTRYIASITYKLNSHLEKIILKYNKNIKELEKEYYILSFLKKHQKENVFQTAAPLFIDKKLSLFAYQKIGYISILEYLYSRKKLYNKIAKRIALGASHFHHISPKIDKKYRFDYKKYLIDTLKTRQQKKSIKEKLSKRDYTKFLKINKKIVRFLKNHPFSTSSLTHGDFQMRNLLLSDKSLWLIDFSRWGVFCPSFDLGDFLLQADKDLNLFASPSEIISFKTAFCNQYFSLNPKLKNKLIKEINLFQAFICLELIDYTSSGGPIYEIGEIFIEPQSFTISNLLKKAKNCLENKKIDLSFNKYY